MKDKISFDNIPNIMRELCATVQKLSDEIEKFKMLLQPKAEEYMTTEKVAEMLSCNRTTIHNWTLKGKLKKHYLGNKVYFKLSEIEQAMQSDPLIDENK